MTDEELRKRGLLKEKKDPSERKYSGTDDPEE